MSDTDDTEDGGIKSLDEWVLEALALEAEGAKQAGALGYMGSPRFTLLSHAA